ncbi:MAG: S8 family peptidase [Planctomycetota bacterium]
MKSIITEHETIAFVIIGLVVAPNCFNVSIDEANIAWAGVTRTEKSDEKQENTVALDDKAQLKPNDPLFPQQQMLFDKINILEAWKTTKGNPHILVGIIDFGFDFFHPDLNSNLVPGFYASGGYYTECYEIVAHGTLVASIIAAKENNKIGMAGLAPHCRILTASHGMIEHKYGKLLRKFRQDHPEAGPGDKEWAKLMQEHRDKMEEFSTKWVVYMTSSQAEAIRYLVEHEVKVINISGYIQQDMCPCPEAWQDLEHAFEYAAKNGVVIVIGAGNNAIRSEGYPGDPNSMIVAGATMLDDTRWEEVVDIKGSKIKQGTNFGKRLTVMAPTENIQVCIPHEKRFYIAEDGPMGPAPTELEFETMYEVVPRGATSSAAPIVTSLVALVHSVRPDLDAKSVIEIIKQGCDDIGDKGYDIYTGYGRVNFGKTIKIALAWKK